MRVALVLGVIGHLLRRFWLAFAPPLALALVDGDTRTALHFAAAGALCFALGRFTGRWFPGAPVLSRAEALAIVAGTWVAVSVVAAVPYVLAGLRPVDALFESVSGFTTTGATILPDFSPYGRAFFLWRAMTQWFGGLGVIALFVVVLPRLGIAGRQLFFAEASIHTGESISTQVRGAAKRLWILYSGLTVLLIALLHATGFPLFDAVTNALTTLAAGGFSPNPRSIEGYANPAAEWILVVFMVLASTSFPLQWRALSGRPMALLKDGEFLLYAGFLLVSTLGLALLVAGGMPGESALRASAFQITSLASSTGFASLDYEALWGEPAKAVLLGAMLMGGCAGSACGGPKVVRYLILLKFLRRELTQVLHPDAVLPVRLGGRTLSTPVLRSVITLVVLYLAGYLLVGLLLPLLDPQVDLKVGFSASVACFGNVGPGFGLTGPMGSYAPLNDAAKLLLTLAMWLGRLEIVTVLALLQTEVLRTLRWRDAARPPA